MTLDEWDKKIRFEIWNAKPKERIVFMGATNVALLDSIIKQQMNMSKQTASHLRFDIMTAHLSCDETRHAQVVMKELGITYQDATPQSMGEQWWFWNCENIPDQLPEYLTVLDVDPMKCIGYGLSEEQAVAILNYKSNT